MFREQQQRQDLLGLENEISYNQALIQEREQGIQEIETAMAEVHELFCDLGLLVSEQQGVLESSAVRTRAAVRELVVARDRHRRRRGNICFIAFIAFFVFIIAVAVISAIFVGALAYKGTFEDVFSRTIKDSVKQYQDWIGMTATEGLLAQNGSGVPSYNAPTKYDVNDIVMHFGREYYTMLSCEPERLHCFYGKQSSLLHCQEDETEATVCVGLEEIHERLASMGYNGARVVIGNIDCQPSMNGGILIFVLGTMHWPTGVVRKFTQTFLLAEQPNGYFVLNDIMRILSEAAVPNPVEKKPTITKPVSIETVVSIPEPVVVDTKTQPQKPAAEPVVKEKTVEAEKVSKPAEKEKEKSVEKPLPKAGGEKKKQPQQLQQPQQSQQTQNTPSKAVSSQAEEERVTATTPSSWAKLAAVQQSRWQSGVVAESKGPVASIAVEGEKPSNEPAGRLNYRTNGERRGESQSQQRDQPRDGHSEKRPIPEYDPAKALYIHEISGRINRDHLSKKFEEFGAIKAFEAVISKGIAFIEYETVEARNAAVNAKIVYNGSTLAVEPRRAGRRDSQPRDAPTTQNRRHYTSSRNSNQQQPRE
ncbi:hypothetical protein PSACC_03489 [Paramicrosporidium saccamoebae]|uniref:NTF2 domain-containing protein n=1 Tax=Paramicrosporidium saccamoebae TaxID=1246581 RepID=A0A2H9TG54_9FUNG|nr:hypothetical protein PSACC_03489 [Paramicrosporidium saccamoebae]